MDTCSQGSSAPSHGKELNAQSEEGSSVAEGDWEAEDDVHGGRLDPVLVKRARDLEMQIVKGRQIYEYAEIQECLRRTGAPLVGVRWVDTNKGDHKHLNYRSRLVAMEFRRKQVATIFAATPPLEAVRLLLAILTSRQPRRLDKGEKAYKIALFDVSRAHCYAEAVRERCISSCHQRIPKRSSQGCAGA